MENSNQLPQQLEHTRTKFYIYVIPEKWAHTFVILLICVFYNTSKLTWSDAPDSKGIWLYIILVLKSFIGDFFLFLAFSPWHANFYQLPDERISISSLGRPNCVLHAHVAVELYVLAIIILYDHNTWTGSWRNIFHRSSLTIVNMQSSRWALVLWPKTSKTLFRSVNFSVFI